MNPMWFLRAKRWAQNPPSMKKVLFVAGIIVFCLAVFAFERFFGWPDALTPNNLRAGPRLRP